MDPHNGKQEYNIPSGSLNSDQPSESSFDASKKNSVEAQRQAAVNIARRQVLSAYDDASRSQTETFASSAAASTPLSHSSLKIIPPSSSTSRPAAIIPPSSLANNPTKPAIYSTSPSFTVSAGEGNPTQPTTNTAAGTDTHLKDQPVATKINSESWKRYHSAWQNYYQKYYSNYYARAAGAYIAKERLKDARSRSDSESLLSLSPSDKKSKDSENVSSDLRQNLRKKAAKNAKKARRRRHLFPILAGVFVVLLILFIQYNRLIFAPIFAYVSPGNVPANHIEALDPTVTQGVSADPRLIIPKLNIDVPIHFSLPLDQVMSAMNSGVAQYRIPGADAYPGEVGNTIITGHSAGDIYSANPYKYIFSGLERLENGDLIYVNYEAVRYTYQVVKKEVVEPTNVAALVVDTDIPILTLVTCTPLGTSRYRLLVTAEQISPAYDSTINDTGSQTTGDSQTLPAEDVEGATLPANEPSFFERIWNFLTGN